MWYVYVAATYFVKVVRGLKKHACGGVEKVASFLLVGPINWTAVPALL